MSRYISIADAVRATGVPRQEWYRLVNRARPVPHIRTGPSGGRIRIDSERMEAYLAAEFGRGYKEAAR